VQHLPIGWQGDLRAECGRRMSLLPANLAGRFAGKAELGQSFKK